MPRIALGIEYDGTAYMGWQRLSHGPSVQLTLERALSRIANEPVQLFCAGRTDSGVHASMQVAHFDTQAIRPDHGWVLGCNATIPDDISILWAKPVEDSFHARFSARGRSYRYTVMNRWPRPALLARTLTWEKRPLDAEKMHRAAQSLLGEHDFSSFRASRCQSKTPIKTIDQIRVQRQGNRVEMYIHANAFLHHMIRNIMGVLLPVGRGEQPVEWVEQVLAARDRRCAGKTAPAFGLVFLGPDYEEKYELPTVEV